MGGGGQRSKGSLEWWHTPRSSQKGDAGVCGCMYLVEEEEEEGSGGKVAHS